MASSEAVRRPAVVRVAGVGFTVTQPECPGSIVSAALSSVKALASVPARESASSAFADEYVALM